MKPSDPLWLITWQDIVSVSGWFDKHDLEAWEDKEEGVFYTSGWIVKETKKYLYIASTLESDGKTLSDAHRLPLANVLTRTRIEIVKPAQELHNSAR